MHTYFIHSPKLEAVKIGRSVQPSRRLKALKGGNPDELQILGTVDGDREGEFHQRFAEYRTKGEWFSIGPKLADFLKAQFAVVLRQRKRPTPRIMMESWKNVVDRAEDKFNCGLRHTEYDEFDETVRDLIEGHVGDDELGDDTESGDWIVWGLEKWWPWVMGWNVKNGGWLDVFILFKRPDQARMREDLLREIAHWGYLSDDDPVEFIRLNIAFCWRRRLGSELVGEIAGPVIIDDAVEFLCSRSLKVIGIDELFGFKILGDNWYRRTCLPIPAEAMAMATLPAGELKTPGKKPRLDHSQIPLFPLTQP